MGEILSGTAVAAKVKAEVRQRVAALVADGVQPGLAVVLVGDDPASAVYVRHKAKACEQVGIASMVHRLPAATSQATLLELLGELNHSHLVHGILVQLPLPEHLEEHVVLEAIDPRKDVDGFHYVNVGHLATDRAGLEPCTPRGVIRLLVEHGVPLRGRHAVVVGRSRIVGRPMAAMLLACDATVTVCHRHTPDTAALARQADVLVVAVGKPGLVRRDWVKPGAVVVDVGTSRLPDGKLAGDVAWDEVAPIASLISPVPGGVGPMTIAMLLENTCEAAERLRDAERAAARPA